MTKIGDGQAEATNTDDGERERAGGGVGGVKDGGRQERSVLKHGLVH